MGDSESKQFGDQFLGKLSGQLDKKAPVFGKSLFVGAGDGTRGAWNAGTNFSNDLISRGGLTDPMKSAMGDFSSIGTGYGAAADRSRSALTPIGQGFGSAVSSSDAMLSPLYGGFGDAVAGSDASLSPLLGEYERFGSNGGLNADQSGALADTRALGGEYDILGNAFGADAPGFQRLRSKLQNDTATGIYNDFNNSGLFGSDVNMRQAGEGIADALAGLDYTNFTNDVNNRYRALDAQRGVLGDTFNMAQTGRGNELAAITGRGNTANAIFGNRMAGLGAQGDIASTIFGNRMAGLGAEADIANTIFGNDTAALAGQQGAATSLFNAGKTGITNEQAAIDALGQIGAAQDADAQGRRLGNADLFERKNGADLARLAQIASIFGDPIGAANEAPWWQQGLGALFGFGGKALAGGAFGG